MQTNGERSKKLRSRCSLIVLVVSLINPSFWRQFRSGIAKRLKEHNPNIKIVGVDPAGSILAQPEHLNDPHRLEAYHVEGIGYDFIPAVCDRTLVDTWMKSNDKDSLVMMRQLIRHEGLLCGGSSGAAVSCALRAAKSLQKGQRCVVIMPDSVRNYMSKALSDDWMLDHGFVDNKIIKTKQFSAWWAKKRVCDLPSVNTNTPLTITSDVSCRDAIALLKEEGFDMVPVCEDDKVLGVVTEGNMTNRLLTGRASPDTTVREAGVIYKTFHEFTMQDRLSAVAHALDHDPFVLIIQTQRCYSGASPPAATAVQQEGQHQPDPKRRKRAYSADDTAGMNGGGVESIDDTTVTTTESPSSAAVGSKGKKRRIQQVMKRSVVSAIVTRIDLLEYIAAGEDQE